MKKIMPGLIIVALTIFSLGHFVLPAPAPGEPLPPRGRSPANPDYIEPQTYNFKNQPDGFNGIKWGMTLAEAESAKGVKLEFYGENKENNRTVYTIPGDKNEIFGVQFPHTTYTFLDGQFKLMNIRQYLPDPDKRIHQKLLDALVENYGPPTRAVEHAGGRKQCLEWRGTKTYISLNYNTDYKDTGIDFISPSIAYFSVYHAEQQAKRDKEKQTQTNP